MSMNSAEDYYCVVASNATMKDPDWALVVETLQQKHTGEGKMKPLLATYEEHLNETRDILKTMKPLYTAFVAPPTEAGRSYVADVTRITRTLDDDNAEFPYTGTCWGIVTGIDAQNALEMALCPGFTINYVTANTLFDERCIRSGVWHDENEAGLVVELHEDGTLERRQGPQDSTSGVAQCLSKCDLFITSSHGTERSLTLGHNYRNGHILSAAGRLYGKSSDNVEYPVEGGHDKAWLASGNCLIAHIDGPDAFALAMMKTGTRAASGYTCLNRYGFGWGLRDYFAYQPGRYTYAEANWAYRLSLEHTLYGGWPQAARQHPIPGNHIDFGPPLPHVQDWLCRDDGCGLIHDRDIFAFYGDPAAAVVMASKWCAYSQELTTIFTDNGVVWTLSITGNDGDASFAPVRLPSNRIGGRPIVQFLPKNIDLRRVSVTEGAEFEPVLGRRWILVPRPRHYQSGQTLRVSFLEKFVD